MAVACRDAGGFYDHERKVCKLGDNYIREVSENHYEIVTPVGRFEVNGYVPKRGRGVFFPFNNCGIDVARDGIYLACYAFTDDSRYGVAFETTFSAEISPRFCKQSQFQEAP